MITSDAEIKIEKKITDNLYLLSVKLDKYRKWTPGMFMQLSLEKKGASEPWLDSRAFSFASWGSSKALILVRREGTFTQTLISQAQYGFKSTVKYPFGSFLLNENSDKVFLAGGSGISVFLSYLDFLNYRGSQKSCLALFHSVKSSYEELNQIYWDKIPSYTKVYQFITDENDKGYTGRLTDEFLFNRSNKIDNVNFYICGPTRFNDYWASKVKERGLIPRVEQWINKVNLV